MRPNDLVWHAFKGISRSRNQTVKEDAVYLNTFTSTDCREYFSRSSLTSVSLSIASILQSQQNGIPKEFFVCVDDSVSNYDLSHI